MIDIVELHHQNLTRHIPAAPVTPEMFDALTAAARKLGVSKSAIIRHAVSVFLADNFRNANDDGEKSNAAETG